MNTHDITSDSSYLIEEFKKNGIILNEIQSNRLIEYYNLLVEKNKVMNLTAITDFKEVVIKHFIDSILISKVYDMSKVNKLIDVGTGAGFPGIPLKIMYENLNITLLDSLNKRINFLNEVIEKLELDNINCIHGRAEDFGSNIEYREKYDICVSRAVANLSVLSEYCIPFIKVNGIFIAYKSSNSEEEIKLSENAVKKLGCKIIKTDVVSIKDTDINRIFVNVQKNSKTNKLYPRKAGTPTKKPL